MKKQLLTENDVKKYLHIDDFRKITKKQIINLTNNLYRIDPEVAKKIVEQIPHFFDASIIMLDRFDSMCENILKHDGEASISAYQEILRDLRDSRNSKESSPEDVKYFTEQMIFVAQRIEAVEDKKREFANTVIRTVGVVTMVFGAIGAALLGANTSLEAKPKNDDAEENSF